MIKLAPVHEMFNNKGGTNPQSDYYNIALDQKNVEKRRTVQLNSASQRDMRHKLITIKRLNTSALKEEACVLLHEVYILRQNWQFSSDNPSKLRVEVRGNKKMLVDRFIDRAIWFGAFDDDKLVGCARLCSEDENNQLEVETYPSSQPIRSYFPLAEKNCCYEITKIAVGANYLGKGVFKRLLLACFRFCQENQYHAFINTHNGYLKLLFKKIAFPIKKEYAFKYEPQDVSAVTFYFADYKKSEVSGILKNLECLENNISNNALSIFNALQTVESILPTPFYWMNAQGVVLGINELMLMAMGTTREIIGKKPYAFYKPEIAEHILKHNAEVMLQGAILSQEEWVEDVTTKERICFSSIKAPLYDDEGTILGIVGTSIDITAQKEAELLRLENETQKTFLQEQEKFRKLADQVAHDIRSPLASLLMIVRACQAIPERERVALREAATTIGDIANNLLSNYRKKEVDHDHALSTEERESVLVSPLLLQILTDKKYQYQNLAIKFTHHFSQAGNFAWIKIEPTAFKRMLSNIINNSVDAVDQKEGKITLYFDADDEEVRLTIEDNGKGMKPELVQKILDHSAVTDGKENGHGIGLTQVRETLENNQGEWIIDSQIDHGTQFILTFPRAPSLNWIAETIRLENDDTVVILDDDSSIHMAWDIRFDVILKKFPQLTIKHFELGQEAIDFINDHTPDKKQKIFLLTDYELLKQDLDGLGVIKETQISRSILVTSHYANKQVQQLAAETNTKILPKQLASDIAIKISKTTVNENAPIHVTGLNNEVKEVDVVFVDDDQRLLDSFTFFAFNKKVDTYQDPQIFLNSVNQYPKHTKIMLDQHYANFDQKGMQIAEHLHTLGFTQLYLLSGESFSGWEIPDYLTAILKTDLDKIEAALNR